MKFKAVFLSSILAILPALAPGARAADLKQLEDIYKAGYVPLNEVTAPLLHHVNTGKPFDTWTLLDNAGSVLPPEIGEKYRQYYSVTSAKEKNRLAGELGAFTRDLSENLRQAKGYLVKLTHQLGAYDSKKKVLPIGLNMPTDKSDSGAGRHYCPGSFSRTDGQLLTSCVTVRRWESAHGELKEIPLEDKAVADMLTSRLSSGALAFYALLQPAAAYQPVRTLGASAIPGQPDKAIAGILPLKLVGLALVNHESGGLVNVARIDGSADIFKTAENLRPQYDSDPAAPPRPSKQGM